MSIPLHAEILPAWPIDWAAKKPGLYMVEGDGDNVVAYLGDGLHPLAQNVPNANKLIDNAATAWLRRAAEESIRAAQAPSPTSPLESETAVDIIQALAEYNKSLANLRK